MASCRMQDVGCKKQGANGTVATGERTMILAVHCEKFPWDCENFSILAKFSLCKIFAKLAKFRYLAKITIPSKIFHFRYLL